MRIFANLFLIMFLTDGTLSIFDELLSLFSITALSGARNLFADAVIVMAVPVYLCLGIDKRLPKRVFLPLVVFILWCPLSTWFFPSLSGSITYGLLAAFGQVFLCILPISHVRKMGGHSLLMTKQMFRSPFFSLRNTLLFAAANLLIIPIVLVLLGLAAANSFLVKETSGFARLAPNGLHMTERVYKLGNKTIRLVGMIHVGEKEYYDDLIRPAASGRTVILTEGVTDGKNLLQNKFGYGKMADVLGLTSQERMRFNGRHIDAGEIEKPGFKRSNAGTADILRADVDISAFHPVTIRFLNMLGKYLRENPSFIDAMIAFNAWAKQNMTPAMQKTIMDDILHRRNSEVIRTMSKALSRYDTIIIPWGALHMPEIEESVLERGFTLQESRERTSIDFKKLLLGRFPGIKSEGGKR